MNHNSLQLLPSIQFSMDVMIRQGSVAEDNNEKSDKEPTKLVRKEKKPFKEKQNEGKSVNEAANAINSEETNPNAV